MSHPTLITIDEASAADGDEVATFLRSLPVVDSWLRFGGRPEWLLERLFREQERGATIARAGRTPVGLIDFVHARDGLEFGVVVAAPYRRRGIASAMLRATLERAPRADEPVLAYASWSNVPAVRWLQNNGFIATPGATEPLLFVLPRQRGSRAPRA